MIDAENLNKLKIALQQIENGEEPGMAVANAEYVNYNQQLIDKINILKNIPVLNTDIIKYLYSINLTDKVSDVEPKVNAIYQLALSANLIEDKALEEEAATHEETDPVVGMSNSELAANVLKAFLGMKNK